MEGRARATSVMAIASLMLALAACSTDAGPVPAPTTQTAQSPSPTPSSTTPSTTSSSSTAPPLVAGALVDLGAPQVLAERLEVPWGLGFLPDGSALVAERRSGDVRLVSSGGPSRPVGRVPGVADRGEGGLLGLAVVDDGATVLAYLTSTEGDNRVVAMPYTDGRLGEPRVLVEGIPAGRTHNGGRLAVGQDGKLWIGTGDAGDPALAQDRRSLGGKILRIELDGSVPADNPFPGSPVWSFGHRNVQGLAFDSAGRLWATEFGQNRFDELNLVGRGGDHGWPEVEGQGGGDGDGYVDPVVTWSTDEASPSGLAIVDDVAYVAALRGRRLWEVPLTQDGAGEPRAALRDGLGRIRTVALAPDGSLWITTSNRDGRGDPVDTDDRVVRVPRG